MWTTEMLSSVVNISPGNSIPAKKKSELFTEVKGMPYVATKDVSYDGIINYDNGICIPQDYLNNFRVSPKYATLICAEGGSAGRKIAFSHNECCYVNKLFSLQPTNKIIPKFLYYYSISAEFQLQFKAALHGLIGGVSLTKMKKFAISYPSIPEQERIVAKLDVTFTEIESLNKITSLRKAELAKLKKALLLKTLSSEKSDLINLGDVCELIYGKGLDKIDRLENDGIPAYGANGIKAYSTKILSDEPSIIIGRKGSAGELTRVSSAFWALDVTYYTKINKKLIDLDFLYYTLSSMDLPSMAKGVKPGINRNDVYKRLIYLPALEEQKHIVSILDAAYIEIEKVNDLVSKLKNNCDAFKTAILKEELQSSEAA